MKKKLYMGTVLNLPSRWYEKSNIKGYPFDFLYKMGEGGPRYKPFFLSIEWGYHKGFKLPRFISMVWRHGHWGRPVVVKSQSSRWRTVCSGGGGSSPKQYSSWESMGWFPKSSTLRFKIDGLPILKGGLVEGQYKQICRDRAICFSLAVYRGPS